MSDLAAVFLAARRCGVAHKMLDRSLGPSTRVHEGLIHLCELGENHLGVLEALGIEAGC